MWSTGFKQHHIKIIKQNKIKAFCSSTTIKYKNFKKRNQWNGKSTDERKNLKPKTSFTRSKKVEKPVTTLTMKRGVTNYITNKTGLKTIDLMDTYSENKNTTHSTMSTNLI